MESLSQSLSIPLIVRLIAFHRGTHCYRPPLLSDFPNLRINEIIKATNKIHDAPLTTFGKELIMPSQHIATITTTLNTIDNTTFMASIIPLVAFAVRLFLVVPHQSLHG